MIEEPRHQIAPAERENILRVLRDALTARPDVVFAYLFGSFTDAERSVHDIDVGVFFAGEAQASSEAAFELGELLQRLIRQHGHRIPVDVRPLNLAPLGFRFHVYRGRLLASRDEELRVHEVATTAARYLDILPLQRRALKEAMLA